MSDYWDRSLRLRTSRRRVLGGAGAAGIGAAGLVLVGCGDDDDGAGNGGQQPTASGGSSPDASQPKQGGTYRWAGTNTPHLDAHQDSVAGASNLTPAVYNRLLRYKDDAQSPEPDLATGMPEQPDDLTFVFTIHEGVQFHDKAPVNGRVMTAADVAFSLNRARTDQPAFIHKGDLASVDKIEAVDDKTVRVTTKFPNAIMLTTLAGIQFFVLAPETIDQFGDLKTDRATIGTGAFIMDSFGADTGAKLKRNPAYWRTGKPYFEALEQVRIDGAWQQYLAGNVEVAGLTADVVDGFDSFEEFLESTGVESYTYRVVDPNSAQAHFMNNAAAPFDDIRIREALNLILDRDPQVQYGWPIGGEYRIAMGDGHARAGFGLTQEEIGKIRGFRKDKRDDDIKDGLALLANAGYNANNPLKWEIMGWATPNRTIGIDELQLAAEMYRQVSGGVLEPSVKGLEWGTWKAAEANHEFQMISSQYSMGVDAHEALQKMYHSEGGRNFAQYKDPAFDAMLQEEQGTFDIDERKELISEMLRYLNDPTRIANAWTGVGPIISASIARVQGRPELMEAGKLDQLYFA